MLAKIKKALVAAGWAGAVALAGGLVTVLQDGETSLAEIGGVVTAAAGIAVAAGWTTFKAQNAPWVDAPAAPTGRHTYLEPPT